MKIFPHLFAKLFCSPLMLIEPVRFSLESHLLGSMGISPVRGRQADLAIANEAGPLVTSAQSSDEQSDRVQAIYETYGNVAVIRIDGVIDKHISSMEMFCYGGCDLDDIDQALLIAAADPRVEIIVLAINSPGGSVTGVPETAARIAAIREIKEVRVFVDSMCCSGAVYLASQADQIDIAPSSVYGSIGVYMTLIDATRAAEMEGYKIEMITAGKYKAMGSPFKPLADDERAMFQASVTQIRDNFRASVRAGRRTATEAGGHQTVLDSAMEGQCFDAPDALAARLCDNLTSLTLDQYVGALLR